MTAKDRRLRATMGSVMGDELEWAKIRQQKPSGFETAKSSALRISLLFGGLVIALGLVVVPLLDQGSQSGLFAGNPNRNIDPITTATIGGQRTETYVIRRSVLQPTPNAKCILKQDGTATGEC